MKKRKLKFDFKLTDYLDLHVLKIYLVVLLSVMSVAVLVVIGVTVYRTVMHDKEMKKPGLYSEQDISSILKSPGLTDFIIPESLDEGVAGFSMYRAPIRQWSEDMVKKYIISPDQLGIDKIRDENKKTLENKLDEVP